jgi:signal transduction histidine kinase
MTLRRRLLLVYLIVVLLSVATVGAAVFELQHARTLFQELQDWNRLVLNFEKLKSAWPPPSSASPEEFDLRQELASRFLYLASKPQFLDVQRVRAALNDVFTQYDLWRKSPHPPDASEADHVRAALDNLARVIQNELDNINSQADLQRARSRVLLGVVICLTAIHVLVIGSLLRRWLLEPMEQLNRQVEALARDEPPAEPILESPQELARLASALDRARQSLGDMRQRLIENERLTTIGQFAAQLAHNLRNPLASIRASAQVASRQAGDSDYVRQRLDEIVKSVDRLNQWIAGLMEVARSRPRQTQLVDVVPTLHNVRAAVTPELDVKECTLELDAPAGGLRCHHDPATLEHALIAIVLNAIEASPPSATITLKAEQTGTQLVSDRKTGSQLVFDPVGNTEDENERPHPVEDPPWRERSEGSPPGTGKHVAGRAPKRDGACCVISVIDCGPGLPPDDPERIFESSYSTKQHGMGLGLALARQVLERQGGAAHARNAQPHGAIVTVELPME